MGRICLEPDKPQQVPVDSTMSFRVHIVWEKLLQDITAPGELQAGEDAELKGLLGLPEEEMEICADSIFVCRCWFSAGCWKNSRYKRGVLPFFAKTKL